MSIENTKYWNHVVRYYSDNLSSLEERELFNWLDQNKNYQEEFNQLKNLWKSSDIRSEFPEFNQEKIWKGLQEKMRNESEEKLATRVVTMTNNVWLRRAAVFLLIVSIGLLLKVGLNTDSNQIASNDLETEAIDESIVVDELILNDESILSDETIEILEPIVNNEPKLKKELVAMIKIVSPKDKSKIFILPDGTKIELKKNSTFEYPKNFSKNNRDAVLIGEANFDVTPDSKRPFTIVAGNTKTTVLGTSFNINTRNEDSQVIVEVFSGKVEFSSFINGSIGSTIILIKEEKGIFRNSIITKESTKKFDIGIKPIK
ncbi:MAG: hypothetical protein COA97_06530 [Flavobacteriales bacterium]|nr:MAG: hypothetical protein COA97_06530 [Flavobacteriales bacterium]